MIISPVTYQGAKNRIASPILDIINAPQDTPFTDLCCGGGSITIELINRGMNPQLITMLDISPWGMFWEHVGNGTFDMSGFKSVVYDMPTDPRKVYDYIVALANQSVSGQSIIFNFLLLQAASFGGKAISYKDGKWVHSGFRQYWLPTATSSRRSPVNPMMPMPLTVLDRVETICKAMIGVRGIHGDIRDFFPVKGTVYIDPPYQSTEVYAGGSFSVMDLKFNQPFYVSEAKPLSDKHWLISDSRSKGGITGVNKNGRNKEYLSYIIPSTYV